ncbi:SMI1/KNR4 family protein [Fibrella sp. WM1]|uniref:SMI1/KNR4 family protein n=1 Tax=Fibrella musci TaxID=3242485 RepID=UPI0035202C63
MNNLVEKYTSLVASCIPRLESSMNPGCSPEQIMRLEQELGVELPESYKQLLSWHDGEKQIKILLGHSFISASEVLSIFKRFLETRAGIRDLKIYQPELILPFYFNKKRVPFAHDHSGQYMCIDYEPGKEGRVGQIIYLPLGEPEPISVVANSFDDYLAFLISAIQSGRLKADVYDEPDDDYFEAYFVNYWRDDWTDIADEYNQKGRWS